MNEIYVPALDGTVEVRPIPPKLLRAIKRRATKGGRVDFQALMIWKLVHGLIDPSFTEAEARQITRQHSLRALQPIIDRIDVLSGTDEHLRHRSDRTPRWLRQIDEATAMASAWIGRFPAVKQGRSSRQATNARPRGSRRVTGSGSTSSGEDDGESERACANCDRPLPPDSPTQRHFCEDPDCKRARDRDRKRQAPVHLKPRSEYACRRLHWPKRTVGFDPDLDCIGAADYVQEYGNGAPKRRGEDLKAADDFEARAAERRPAYEADAEDHLDSCGKGDAPPRVVAGVRATRAARQGASRVRRCAVRDPSPTSSGRRGSCPTPRNVSGWGWRHEAPTSRTRAACLTYPRGGSREPRGQPRALSAPRATAREANPLWLVPTRHGRGT